MTTVLFTSPLGPPQYAGLRMSAEEYFRLEDDGARYELIDGVIVMSPSPSLWHQGTLEEILFQLSSFLRRNPIGKVYPEVDVHVGRGPEGGDIIYRPELVYLRNEQRAKLGDNITGVVPDLVVEIISPTSRRYDTETKRADYERFGIPEYWIIDPDQNTMMFLQLDQRRYSEAMSHGDRYESRVLPGFVLQLELVKRTFKS